VNELATEKAVLDLLSSSSGEEDEAYLSLTTIFEKVAPRLAPHVDSYDFDDDLRSKESLRVTLDDMVADGLLESRWGERDYEASYRITDQGQYEASGFDALFAEVPHNVLTTESGEPLLTEDGDFLIVQDAPTAPLIEVDTTDWTGLAKAVSPQQLLTIKDHSRALQIAIMQSDADIQTKTDACKRVEAVLLLLEAPNVPWREVVALLNHPSVTAFLAAVSLIQFIIGLAA
jgi:hypothetical protein